MPGQGAPSHVRDHMVLCLSEGEFVSYRVAEPGEYTLHGTYSADESVKLRVSADGKVLFEGELPAAAQERPGPEEKHPLFPEEPAPNRLKEVELGKGRDEAMIKVEVLSGSMKLGKVIVRRSACPALRNQW